MEYQEQWEQFEETGKVADYLAYCRQAGQMSAGNIMDGSALGMAVAENVMWSGSVRNAGAQIWSAQKMEYHRREQGMRETITVTGMILQTSPLKEYDRRVEILTKELGRISAFAQGARRPNSALSACTILFTFGTFTLYPGRDSYRLQSGSIQTQFGELAQDYDALCYCSYFGEMARYFTREGVEASRELMLLYVTLRAVMHGKMTLPLVRVIYELRLMLIEGEMVELFQCLHCGTKEVNTVYLQAGGLLCPACAAKDKTTKDAYPLQLSSDALYTLQYILTSEWGKLYAFGVSEEVLRELTHFMKRYLGRYLPHQFKSEAFLK